MVLPPVETDDLFGCTKCRYAKNGCAACRERPTISRPKQRWKPEAGRRQEVRRLAVCCHAVLAAELSGTWWHACQLVARHC